MFFYYSTKYVDEKNEISRILQTRKILSSRVTRGDGAQKKSGNVPNQMMR
jgi:hypothetical protein